MKPYTFLQSDALSYPKGLPPNYRIVKSCATCRHAEHGYEGETRCTLFEEQYRYDDPDEEDPPPQALEVHKQGLCDSYEEWGAK